MTIQKQIKQDLTAAIKAKEEKRAKKVKKRRKNKRTAMVQIR